MDMKDYHTSEVWWRKADAHRQMPSGVLVGVELEFDVHPSWSPYELVEEVGWDISPNFQSEWIVESDASLNNGVEFISDPIPSSRILSKRGPLAELCNAVANNSEMVSYYEDAGTHINVGLRGMSFGQVAAYYTLFHVLRPLAVHLGAREYCSYAVWRGAKFPTGYVNKYTAVHIKGHVAEVRVWPSSYSFDTLTGWISYCTVIRRVAMARCEEINNILGTVRTQGELTRETQLAKELGEVVCRKLKRVLGAARYAELHAICQDPTTDWGFYPYYPSAEDEDDYTDDDRGDDWDEPPECDQ